MKRLITDQPLVLITDSSGDFYWLCGIELVIDLSARVAEGCSVKDAFHGCRVVQASRLPIGCEVLYRVTDGPVRFGKIQSKQCQVCGSVPTRGVTAEQDLYFIARDLIVPVGGWLCAEHVTMPLKLARRRFLHSSIDA